MTLRVVIVDDEPLARRRLRSLLADHADVTVVGEAEDAETALTLVRAERPDVLFLDIQMPGRTGLEFLGSLSVTPRPFAILATAYAEHAVDAFDEGAIDYLLKPFDEGRLAKALDRAREHQRARQGGGFGGVAYLDRVAVTIGARTIFVALADVDWIEASGNYARLHVGKEHFLLRTTMAGLEEQLDPARFVRTHRSAMVQLDRVRELRPLPNGEFRLLLSSGAEVPLSSRYRDRLPR